jgi:iron complex outermembrane recepter protein
MKTYRLFIIFLLMAQCSWLKAQFSISGKITDAESGKMLSGTTVILENSTRGTTTNQQGVYLFKNLPKGSYLLKISYLGFAKIAKEVDLQKDETLDFSLQKSTFVADEVVVSATRANAKSAMAYSDISKEYLQKQNLGQDIPQLLNFTPSLVTTSDAGAGVGYTGIRIRGTDATRINVTINGIPILYKFSVAWALLPTVRVLLGQRSIFPLMNSEKTLMPKSIVRWVHSKLGKIQLC